MNLVHFFKRLVGADAEAVDASRRFSADLKRLDTSQEELVAASSSIESIIRNIELKTEQMLRSNSTSSGVSGQHRIEIPPLPPLPELENDRRKKK